MSKEFDEYLRVSSEFPELTDPVMGSVQSRIASAFPGLLMDTISGACPMQGYGTYLNRPVYFRYRHGYAILKDEDNKTISSHEYGDHLQGSLDNNELIHVFSMLYLTKDD